MLFLKSHPGKHGPRIDQADSASTDDTGAYEFNDLAAGEYLLAVVAEPWYAIHRSSSRARQKSVAAGAPDPAAALDLALPCHILRLHHRRSPGHAPRDYWRSRQEADITLHAVPALRIEVDTPRKPDGSIARAELRQTVFGGRCLRGKRRLSRRHAERNH